ncbi:MAG TPA: DUF5996 family protein [Solirubrobacteraceae bacterium]|nr:DUF5996 family protein [Solirubrobacteraceae bacterium]
MPASWPAVDYENWSATCDTLHAHTQVLGKIAVALAPPEPQFQHSALRLTARGLETGLLPAPDGSGGLVVALDLGTHEAVAEHTGGAARRVRLTPNRPVGEVTRALLGAVSGLSGPVEINPTPQEVSWTVPLDEDDEHATYDTAQVSSYFAAATQVALVLSAFRASYRGRATPVNAWWGSFDLAVNLFSGRPADPPSNDYLFRNAMDSEEVAIGWWPGDGRYSKAAFYAYAHPAREGWAEALTAPTRWDAALGEYILDWNDARSSDDPRAVALDFARSAFRHACAVCGWNIALAASADGTPPPLA